MKKVFKDEAIREVISDCIFSYLWKRIPNRKALTLPVQDFLTRREIGLLSQYGLIVLVEQSGFDSFDDMIKEYCRRKEEEVMKDEHR